MAREFGGCGRGCSAVPVAVAAPKLTRRCPGVDPRGARAGYREHVPTRIVKRTATLADGRDLIYYDDADTRLGPERRIDTRRLEPRPPTAVMRQDVLTGEWISIAAARQSRVVLPPADRDPLAPQTPGNPRRYPTSTTWPCSRTGPLPSVRHCPPM